MKRALISVYDKMGVLELASFLNEKGVEILSTGGTYAYLKENNIPVLEVYQVTGFEEILDGRVKTLHPIIHSGILARRDDIHHMETLERKGILPIDIVVVNLYPFFEKVQQEISFEDKIEFIDIGGPTMLRAAAKNFKDVIVLSDIRDYKEAIRQLEENKEVEYKFKKYLAGKVFNLMCAYDAAVANFLLEEDSYGEYLSLSYKKKLDLRYGENPHQSAAYYVSTIGKGAMRDFDILNGKELSYNNIKDMDIAWKVVNEFDEITCCAVKHNTPCGVASGKTVLEAYENAYDCDKISIFGGIIALNRKVDKETAEQLCKIFLEVIVAPEYDKDALEALKSKKNLRIIEMKYKGEKNREYVAVDGGILVQSSDDRIIGNIEVVTEKEPTDKEMEDMIFGMKVVKYVKSNAIVIVKDKKSVGIGGGQVNRIWAAQQALDRAGGGYVMASDAFFPFNDVVKEAAKYGIKAIIQPGGSLRDKDSIEECNKNGISMVFTGIRHFKH